MKWPELTARQEQEEKNAKPKNAKAKKQNTKAKPKNTKPKNTKAKKQNTKPNVVNYNSKIIIIKKIENKMNNEQSSPNQYLHYIIIENVPKHETFLLQCCETYNK